MTQSHPAIDVTAIEAAVAELAAARPAYASILGFYGPVFVAQIEAAANTSPMEIEIDASVLETKSRQGFSLIEPTAFPIDLAAARTLTEKICRIAVSCGERLGVAAQALLKAMDDGLAIDHCFGEALVEKGHISALADHLNVATEMLRLLFSLATRPSLVQAARQLADRLPNDGADRSHCPICGSAPIIGELDHDGRQWLHCGRCGHRWPVKRLACPFCGNHDGQRLEYLFSDEEPEYRLNLCGACRRYLKVVDVRKIGRTFFPPLEQMASLHLDMLADEQGYHRMRD